jgi:hypothetical protein
MELEPYVWFWHQYQLRLFGSTCDRLQELFFQHHSTMHPEVLPKGGAELLPKFAQFSGYYLVGGTALALQIGHRISVDFDMFCSKEIDKRLLPKIKKVFSGHAIKLVVSNIDELTLFINGIKTTFFNYQYKPLRRLLTYDGVQMLDKNEIAASKAFTIGKRGAYKDYFDLYFLLSGGHITLQEIIALANKKYKDDFNDRLFLEQLVYLDDVPEAEILFLGPRVSERELASFFKKEIMEWKKGFLR